MLAVVYVDNPFVLHNNRPMPKSLVIYTGTTGY